MEIELEAYSSFAQVYDQFMDNVPYEEWCSYICEILKEHGIGDGLVLDLGCGTGKMTRLLAKQGYDMIGVDMSEDMLGIAREHEESEGILYLLQDMREFELYGTVAAVVSICDSMNYLTDYEDLVQTLKLVNNYLDPQGVFIFDMNTVHKYRDLIGDRTIAEARAECSFIWDNDYDPETKINEYDLTLFIQEEDDLYRRFVETHYQKAYELEEVKRAIAEAGMEFVTVYDAFTRKAPDENSERVYFIAREQGKHW